LVISKAERKSHSLAGATESQQKTAEKTSVETTAENSQKLYSPPQGRPKAPQRRKMRHENPRGIKIRNIGNNIHLVNKCVDVYV